MDTPSSGFSRIPPYDADAEQSVISSMLFDREALSVAYEMLQPEDFYRPDHKAVFEAMLDLFIRNAPVDVVTLNDKLTEMGILEQIGGREFIVVLAGSFTTSAHIRHHAKIVAEKAVLRRLIKASNDISADSYEARQSVDLILDKAEKSIFDISQKRNTRDFSHIHEVLVTTLEQIELVSRTKGQITGVPTGFTDFDHMTAGLQPSDLILIAARPSMGKTALILNIATNASVNHNIPTAIFSLEMSKEQMINRMLCAHSMIDSQKVRTGNMEDRDWERIAESVAPLSAAPLYIDDTPGISVSELRAKCRKLKMEKGLGLVMIDYLQLMSGSGRESRQQEISEISRSLKAIAREVQAPVIACSQLSRACEARSDHRPMLSDLRESGAIEQDADVVTFIYRDAYYNKDTEDQNIGELIIAKQRNGPTGTVRLRYFGEYTRFANLEREIH